MTFVDGVLFLSVLLLFSSVWALSIQRKNGMIDADIPEATIRRQLQSCTYKLKTLQQSEEVWRNVANKQKLIIKELTEDLSNYV